VVQPVAFTQYSRNADAPVDESELFVELRDYLRVLRKRWRIIALVALLVIGASALQTALTPKTFSAQTQFFVSTSGADNNGSLLQGNTFTQQRVKSYAQLLETPKVLDPVIDKLKLTTTADGLAAQVTATVPLDTVLIEVIVTDSSPEQAAKIADTIGEQFPATIEQLERVAADKASPVKVTLVRNAQVNPAPILPRPGRNIALGLVLGLLLGLGLALVRDLLDTTIKEERDVEEVTDTTVIGGISYDTDARQHPLIAHADPRSHRAEAFRSLRTNLRFIDAANHPRSIVFTSSVPGEGKTTTTANLALTIAAAGQRVCVIEGDLRRPRLLDYMGLEGSVGLTDVLIGRAEMTELLQQFGETSLWVLGAGAIPPNPSELLGTPVMADTIRELEARFDYVLIDAPPLLPVTDAAVLSTVAGGAVVVVGSGVVHKEHLRRALEALQAVNGNTLGLVVNRIPKGDGNGYGDYRYAYSAESEGRRVKDRRRGKATVAPDVESDPTRRPGPPTSRWSGRRIARTTR